MAPINNPNGNEVSEIVLPNGNTASKVIAPDGTQVFGPIPDSENLQAHYDASDKTDVSTTWAAEVGPDLSTAGGPTIVTAAQNGNNVVRCDGVDDYFYAAFSSGIPSDYDIYIAGRWVSTASSAWTYFIGDNDSFDWRFKENNAQDNSLHADNEIVGSPADTQFHVLSTRWGSSGELRIDGVQDLSGDLGSFTASGITVGATNGAGGGSGYSNIDVGEILFYNSTLSSADRSDVESYLADKWGVAL